MPEPAPWIAELQKDRLRWLVRETSRAHLARGGSVHPLFP
jgi:hypothetical protein